MFVGTLWLLCWENMGLLHGSQEDKLKSGKEDLERGLEMAASRGLPQGEDSAAFGSYRPLHRPLTLGCSSTSRLPPVLWEAHTHECPTHMRPYGEY